MAETGLAHEVDKTRCVGRRDNDLPVGPAFRSAVGFRSIDELKIDNLRDIDVGSSKASSNLAIWTSLGVKEDWCRSLSGGIDKRSGGFL